MPVDPQVRALLDQLASAGGLPLQEMTPEAARQMFVGMAALAAPSTEGVTTEDRSVPGPGGDIPVRIYTPAAGSAPRPLVVFFHGGGFVIGNIDSHDATCRSLARLVGAVVVSVDYRLAPESAAPAAAEDCYAATVWAAEHASELGADAARLAVAGDSAGGNLAAVTPLLARDRGGPAIAFQLLVYPVTDLTMSQPSIEENGTDYMLTADGLRWFYDHYLGTKGDPKEPIVSPLFASDVSGLPPALILTAEFDPLRDEGEAYGARLREAGVPVTFKRYDGLIHGFFSMDLVLDAAKAAVAETAEQLKAALAG
ncbi:MAG TPA: alpha/beta hydrolase [Acidimicrobiales bacterium]|nr:alpha/beta hydrolase [Acidimicrobiales bacterium]